jgi:hypothetical protein
MVEFYSRPLRGNTDGWTATVQSDRWFLAIRSPRYPVMFSEKGANGSTRTLARAFGWRVLLKRKSPVR